jgi:long-subunit fatty acid transport protein
MLFDLVGGLQGSMYTFGLAPHLSYFVADNLSVGARFDYDRSSVNLGNAALSLGDDMSFGISGYNMLKHSFNASLTMRYYMAIADSKRFGLFAEIRAQGGYGQSKLWKQDGTDKYGTYQLSYEGSLMCVPGICVFAHDNVAVEVAVGILGINYVYNEQIRNQVEHSSMQRSGANFKINPLAIELGTCFYFYTGPHSRKARNKGR